MWSAAYDTDLVLVTLGLIFTTFCYDELGLACHWAGKNLCNIGGYATFEIGATMIMGSRIKLDLISTAAVALSGMLIFTTIQVQDFPDVEGDNFSGRVTFPIYAPEFSRIFTLFMMLLWSVALSWYWDVGTITSALFVVLGGYVGARYYLWRTPDVDKRSYVIFNV
ncbi:hypothetical protein EW146_g6221 [Bondarzewia mesenterica]|uniref:Uncharacterized protein n=1 Tax=Bondarzewia mesenterica TaxID=1095465 RepID=A0A4S4LR33_9AGAM|nr:hypothetical protein EW146_g6221 [Bondarzewia mesenterica]